MPMVIMIMMMEDGDSTATATNYNYDGDGTYALFWLHEVRGCVKKWKSARSTLLWADWFKAIRHIQKLRTEISAFLRKATPRGIANAVYQLF